jgi:hypothetical protein
MPSPVNGGAGNRLLEGTADFLVQPHLYVDGRVLDDITARAHDVAQLFRLYLDFAEALGEV